jgi:hypothetical protein
MRMREGKDGGGKGPLLSEGLALTLATGAMDVLFIPPQPLQPPVTKPMAFPWQAGGVRELMLSDPSETLVVGQTMAVLIPPSPAGSPGSAGSTWASNEPGSASSPIPRSSPTPAPSSPATGPTSPTSETSADWGEWAGGFQCDLVSTPGGISGMLMTSTGTQIPKVVLPPGWTPMSGQGDHRAKASASPDSDEDSMTTAAASPSPGLTLWDDTDPALSSSRTYQASSRRLMAWTGTPSYAHWETSGTGGPTGFSTLSGSECPSDGDACSSSPSTLADILTPTAPDRFSLSARAAAGIMRRSAKRGRRLPAELEVALNQLGPSPSEGTEASSPTDRTPGPTSSSWTVRRITPVEGERLMGWPDGHTIAPRRGR